jgi:hypothetical protein
MKKKENKKINEEFFLNKIEFRIENLIKTVLKSG